MDPWLLIGPSKWQFSGPEIEKFLADVGVAGFCQMYLDGTLLCEETRFAERDLKSSWDNLEGEDVNEIVSPRGEGYSRKEP